MQNIVNLGALGKKPDHKLSNQQMVELCFDRVQWLTEMLFGRLDVNGKLVKDEYKDAEGNIKQTTYHVGLLHKIEGVKEFDAEAKQEKIMQPGLEQLFIKLQQELLYQSQVLDGIVLNQKTQMAMFATILKITPQAWFDLTEEKNQEMNIWMQNYKNILDAYAAKQKAEEEKPNEVLKEFEKK